MSGCWPLLPATSVLPEIVHPSHSGVNLLVKYNHFHSTGNRPASKQDEQSRSQRSCGDSSDVWLLDLSPYGQKFPGTMPEVGVRLMRSGANIIVHEKFGFVLYKTIAEKSGKENEKLSNTSPLQDVTIIPIWIFGTKIVMCTRYFCTTRITQFGTLSFLIISEALLCHEILLKNPHFSWPRNVSFMGTQ